MKPQDRRKYPRLPVDIPAKLFILVPEYTFQPLEHYCTVVDISERGAMVVVEILREVHREMLQKTRYCRVQFDGIPDLPDKIIGKAVWIDAMEGEKHRYRIGLFFEDISQDVLARLQRFVAENSYEHR